MSILNVALYGVSLERTTMDDRYESVMNRCSSMSEIREKAKMHKGLLEAFRNSIGASAHFISDRFCQLCLKDEPFVSTCHHTNEQEVNHLFQVLKTIDSNVEITDTTQKALSKCDRLKRFFDIHSIRHHYIFQLRKCNDPACEFGCKPVRLPPAVFFKPIMGTRPSAFFIK